MRSKHGRARDSDSQSSSDPHHPVLGLVEGTVMDLGTVGIFLSGVFVGMVLEALIIGLMMNRGSIDG